jgi:prolyl oligopeptidase (EC:3.4.21.26). Serine peptidase. MEROPS family S09A
VIQSASLADGRVLVNKLKDVKSEVELYASDGKHLATLPLPTLGSVGGISSHADSRQVYYAFTSFLYPTTIFNYDVSDGKTRTVFKPDVPFDPSHYETVQVFYHSKDGTRVPMFLTYRKGLQRNGMNPTLLYAYGGFNISITPSFSPTLPVWLELGGIYAVANIRGGGEYGEAWHKAGMLGNKQNVFDDFAWAAKWLVKNRYTEVRRLGIQGYSNGGLLVGASITENPRLFGAAYAGAGVMDMLRYQKFSGGALWAPEYGTSDVEKRLRVADQVLASGKRAQGRLLPADADHHRRPRRPRGAEPFVQVRRRPAARPVVRQPHPAARGNRHQPQLHAHRQAHPPVGRHPRVHGQQPRRERSAQGQPGRAGRQVSGASRGVVHEDGSALVPCALA